MTTARDVIAKWLKDYTPLAPGEDFLEAADGLLETVVYSSESIRLELAALLNPWRPIASIGPHEKGLVYAPPENLYEKPRGMEGEMRVSTPQNYTWAMFWCRLPAPPSEDK